MGFSWPHWSSAHNQPASKQLAIFSRSVNVYTAYGSVERMSRASAEPSFPSRCELFKTQLESLECTSLRFFRGAQRSREQWKRMVTLGGSGAHAIFPTSTSSSSSYWATR